MKERIAYIDTVKGILIVLMLIGHIWNVGVIHDFIYSFHMPAFFFISGILLKKSSSLMKPLRTAIFKKILSLLVPYLFFEIFAILIHITQYGMILNMKGYLFEILSLHLFNGPLWFLFVMFLSETLFLILYKLSDGFKGKSGDYMIVFLFIMLLFLPQFQAYINITTTVMALFFLLIGYEFPNSQGGGYFQYFFIMLTVVVTVLISFINGGVGMPDYQNGYKILFVLGAVTGSYSVIQISKIIQTVRIAPLNYYGRNSLILLGTHYPIIDIVKNIIGIDEFSIVNGCIFLVVLLVIEIGIIYVINNFFPFMVGKFYNNS